MKKILLSAALLAAISVTCFADEPKAVFRADDANITASQMIYEYAPESLYHVDTQVGYITDIMLKPGEVVQHIAGGDTVQWLVDQATVNGVAHVYIKPKAKGIMTNMIISTATHSYRLVLSSTDQFNPIVSWRFTNEDNAAAQKRESLIRSAKGIPQDIPVFSDGNTKKLNFHYRYIKMKNLTDDMIPISVFDDGVRTYIRMKSSNRYDLPVLYNVDNLDKNKLTLVNYRVKGNMFIADRCFTRARLSFAAKRSLDFVPES
jgi:type IV secretion system protein VirB9